MRIPSSPHPWRLTPGEAIELQRRLASSVSRRPPRKRIRTVAGVDAAFSKDGRWCLSAAVLWHVERREVIESVSGRRRLSFPYVPGLLSFREAPAALAALRKLRATPDALICDAHGIAHPRRFGLACHLGVLSGLPALGCAKSLLVGEHRDPAARRGSRTALVHRGERVGTVLRTRTGVRPVFVSVGHRLDLETAVRLVLRCAARHRLPEPTRLADLQVARARREG